MFLDDVHRLAAVRSFEYDGFGLQLFQDSVQRFANQCVIVDNKNFHKKLSVIPCTEIQLKEYTPTFGAFGEAVVCCDCTHLTGGHGKGEHGPESCGISESPSPCEQSGKCPSDVSRACPVPFESGHALELLNGACSGRRTGVHFAGTCASGRQSEADDRLGCTVPWS